MSTEEPIRLLLELRPGSQPLEGTVAPSAGAPIPFTGWMQLIPILEAAHEGQLRQRDPDASETS